MTSQQEQILIARTVELEKALSEKRLELQHKNRELEIEAALESVRSISLAMKAPADMLEVCRIIAGQLAVLNVKEIRNVQTAIFYEAKGVYFNYEFYVKQDKTLITEVDYRTHTVQSTFADQMMKGPNEFFTHGFTGKEVQDWYAYQQTTNVFLDSYLETASSLNYYWYSLGPVALGMSTYLPLSDEQIILFQRFRNVFGLAYRRYLDIEQAEAQAREALIEVALERVRARTMAMQRSDELAEASFVLDSKVRELGIKTRGCGFNIYGENESTEWFSSELGTMPTYKTPREHFFLNYYEAGQRGETLLVQEFAGEACVAHYDYLCALPVTGEGLRQFKANGGSFPTHQFDHVAYFKYGYLLFITLESVPEAHDIFKRFAKVFEQTYTRFLDLQKAEVQVREAQIELALERVRAKTMAMQRSEDLKEVVKVLYEQLRVLEFQWGAAAIIIMDATTGDMDWWMEGFADGYELPDSYHVPYFDNNGHSQQLEYWKNGSVFAVIELSGEEKKSYDQYYFNQTAFDKAPENTKQLMKQQETVLFSMAYMRYGALCWSPKPITEEQSITLQRFAKVFEQTYTRFLDLQKAEAQAREAIIETALEKIRGRSLGMHHSVEIKDVVSILFEKLKELDLVFDGSAAIHLYTEGSRNAVIWVASPDLSEPSCVNLPYDEQAFEDNPIILDVWHAKETGTNIYNKLYSFEEKNKYFNYVFKHNDFITVPEPGRQFILQAESYTASFIAEKNSLLGANSWTRQLFSNEDFDILRRISKVFEQAYVRFLDLQKAEAQAREALIEVALEKIRSRSLAMHHSDELREVMSVMFQKLTELNVLLGTIAIQIFDTKTKDCVFWVGNDRQEPAMVKLPYDEKIMSEEGHMKDCWDAKEKEESFFNKVDPFEQKNKYFNYVFANNDYSKIPSSVREFIMQAKAHSNCLIIEKHSSLFADSWNEQFYSNESIEILKRVAKVFDQAYVRFLDLQKAEAQAREAQIEVALERVRAGAMAMHHSGEIPEVAHIIWQQLSELKLADFDGCAILVLDEEGTNTYDSWYAFPETVQGDQHVMGVTKYAQDCAWVIKEMFAKYKAGESEIIVEMNTEQINEFLDWVELDNPALTNEIRGMNLQQLYLYAFPYSNGVVTSYAFKNLRKETSAVLKRITGVFDMAYRRFQDLQKAEAQARESQIQLALERVRARTMAMQHSSELREIAAAVHEQLQGLGFTSGFCSIVIMDRITGDMTWWMFFPGKEYPESYYMTYFEHPFYLEQLNKWKQGENYSVVEVSGEEKKLYDKHVFSQTEFAKVPIESQQFMMSFEKIIFSNAYMKHGAFSWGVEPIDDEHAAVLQRFASVFEQCYTRFLDLQKAEAQAREAQIEVALEKVRSTSLAMHKAVELRKVVAVVFQKLKELGLTFDVSGIQLFTEHSKDIVQWVAAPDLLAAPILAYLPFVEKDLEESEILKDFWEAKEMGKSSFNKNYSFVEKNKFFEYAGRHNGLNTIPEDVREFQLKAQDYMMTLVAEKRSSLWVDSYSGQTISSEGFDILKRFTRVFEQAYVRFLDLQKSEEQARESQIQLALERVRARTMAMQHSSELREIAAAMHEQLQGLGFTSGFCSIVIMDRITGDMTWWMFFPGKEYPESYDMPFFEHPFYLEQLNKWKQGEHYSVVEVSGEEKKLYDKHVFSQTEFVKIPIKSQQFMMSFEKIIFSNAYMKHGAISWWGVEQIDSEHPEVLQRFASVFEQCYTRFLDLQKAEIQAREAQVEAALERVRSRTLAMHKSDEFAETAAVVFKQLISLGIAPNRLYIGIIKDDSGKKIELWATDEDGSKVSTQFTGNINRNQSIRKMYEGWKAQQKFITIDLQGKELEEYFNYLREELKVPFQLGHTQKRRVQSIAYFSRGFIGMASPDAQTDETIKLLERFAYVFNLTYTRFNDLQHAEEQTRKAQIEVALERVRARALAMQSSNELIEVANAMREQMGILGQPDLETTAVHLYTNGSASFDSWYAFRPGRKSTGAIVTGTTKFNIDSCELLRELLAAYHSGINEYTIELSGPKMNEWLTVLYSAIPVITTSMHEEFKETLPKTYFHAADFSGGSLVMVTYQPPSLESMNLQKRAASVFDLAYRRFLDLQHKEEQALKLLQEKERLEITLTELRATQSQLIQSEKMASLGELTAGIAHEIQNPLNFVNNFSDVSKELLDEMKTELDNGNTGDAKVIANDVIQNLEKINHHGKRAEAIVKGMLQHSRSSSGTKEPTNINALADEYLRLAYHGLRAKDKNFNAEIITHFDETIGNINIIPQDIGRMILNLYNNAFYAVAEKKKQQSEGFAPTVSLSTKKIGDKIEIKVADNGNGIPQKILDKIFQPFFTTKPTGQGTGLGLSLSYDIVKAHRGEIKVVSKEGEGTEFKILLPMN